MVHVVPRETSELLLACRPSFFYSFMTFARDNWVFFFVLFFGGRVLRKTERLVLFSVAEVKCFLCFNLTGVENLCL